MPRNVCSNPLRSSRSVVCKCQPHVFLHVTGVLVRKIKCYKGLV